MFKVTYPKSQTHLTVMRFVSKHLHKHQNKSVLNSQMYAHVFFKMGSDNEDYFVTIAGILRAGCNNFKTLI